MVRVGINMIDAQSIGPELLHQLDIALALLRIDEGVIGSELVRNTYSDHQ